jgi:hypothetical protein
LDASPRAKGGEVVQTEPGFDVVAGVGVGPVDGRLDHHHLGGDVGQGLGGLAGMLAAGLIAVGDDGHIGAAEGLAVLGPPGLAGTARGGGGRHAEPLLERVGVLLALDEPHPFAGGDGLGDPGQPV